MLKEEKISIELIQNFVARQQLVLDAMLDLFPGLPIMLNFIQFESEEEHIEVVRQTVAKLESGFWGDKSQWKYGQHGTGCKLVHTISGEPIEWDAPHLDVFDRYWFGNWIRWYAKSNNIENLIGIDNNSIHESLLEMERQGLLGRGNPPEPARFRLITPQ